MNTWVVLFILLSFGVSAHDEPLDLECIPDNNNNSFAQKLLNWWGANEKEVMNAPCKTKVIPSEEVMLRFINDKADGKKTKVVHGVRLKNESPALIEAFRDFTTAMDSWGIMKSTTDQVKIQEKYQINPECEKVLCAMKKIWGNDLATKMLYIKMKHNYNTSEYAFKNSDRFRKDELNDVLIGLEDLPAHLVPVGKKNQRLTKFKRGYTLPSYGKNNMVVANAVMMLFSRWSEKKSPQRQYTIFHELAHNVSSKLNDMDDSPQWLAQSGWIKKGDKWELPTPACFISEYGTENPWEDYAESLTAYRFNGAGFKKKCPKKYNFIRHKVFSGLEYTDPKSCLSPKP
jgi:hypothetical protein